MPLDVRNVTEFMYKLAKEFAFLLHEYHAIVIYSVQIIAVTSLFVYHWFCLTCMCVNNILSLIGFQLQDAFSKGVLQPGLNFIEKPAKECANDLVSILCHLQYSAIKNFDSCAALKPDYNWLVGPTTLVKFISCTLAFINILDQCW